MSGENHYQFIVIGGGVIGSASAYHLLKGGATSVLLLEQFPLPHTRGSSHGHSRIVRKAYPSHHWYYSRMVPDSLEMWKTLEQETGKNLFRKTGVLSVCFEPKVMSSVEKSMQQSNIKYRKLDRRTLAEEYPMVGGKETSQAMYEDNGGVLYADKCVTTLQEVVKEKGGIIHDSEAVLDIVPGEITRVRTSRSTYTCTKLIITAGPWAPKILKPLGVDLPLKPERVTVLYWKEKTPGMFNADRFPCLRYVQVIDGKHNLYGLPADEYPGMFKLCFHDGLSLDPDIRDTDPWDVDIKTVSKFIATYIPDLESKPSIIERCYYTMTPDVDYVLDTHPRWSNIVIGAGFSGHGFKLAPISGWILSELANGRRPQQYEMDKFSISRFSAKKAAAKL